MHDFLWQKLLQPFFKPPTQGLCLCQTVVNICGWNGLCVGAAPPLISLYGVGSGATVWQNVKITFDFRSFYSAEQKYNQIWPINFNCHWKFCLQQCDYFMSQSNKANSLAKLCAFQRHVSRGRGIFGIPIIFSPPQPINTAEQNKKTYPCKGKKPIITAEVW